MHCSTYSPGGHKQRGWVVLVMLSISVTPFLFARAAVPKKQKTLPMPGKNLKKNRACRQAAR